MVTRKGRGGRPKKEIDKKTFEQLCAHFCSQVEICEILDVDHKTLNAWVLRTYTDADGQPMSYSQVYEQKQALGKVRLRQIQFELAKKSAAMAIFLGKQYLGQRDYTNIDLNANVNPFAELSDEDLQRIIKSSGK